MTIKEDIHMILTFIQLVALGAFIIFGLYLVECNTHQNMAIEANGKKITEFDNRLKLETAP